jgi:hypothetical protein
MQKINFKRSLLVTALIASSYGVFSQKAEAGYCLPMQYGTLQSPAANNFTGPTIVPTRETTTGCTGIKTTDTLTGKASALIESIKFQIKDAGQEVRKQMEKNAAAVVTTVSSGDATIVKALGDTTNTTMQDELKLKRSFLKMEMDYMSELKEREVRAAEAPMDLDDTKEEVQFMQYALANTDKKHAQEVIADMQAKYPNGKLIPVKIKSGSSTDTGEKCPEYDPAKPNAEGCFVPHKAFPAAKLAKYFDECSRSKRRVVSAAKKTATEKTVAGQVQKSQNEFAATTTKLKDSVLNNKIITQAEVNCNPYDFAKKFCLQSMNADKGAYVAKVVANEIIPNGNISSNNLFKPLAVGTIDGEFADNLTESEKKSSGQVGLDLNSKSGGQDVAVSDNTVPIVYTYRTSSQYLAAKDFVDNVLAKELIPNQDISDRKSGTGIVYQSRFLSRAAAMSVAEFSMNKTIESRIGKNLKDAIDSGKNMNPYIKDKSGALGTVVKEDVNGAAWIDEIADSINKDYQKVIVSASKEANGGTAESLASMSSKKPEEWQLEAIIKQNELTLEQYHQGERMEFLLASLLAQLSNSPENIKHLEDLRRQ